MGVLNLAEFRWESEEIGSERKIVGIKGEEKGFSLKFESEEGMVIVGEMGGE